MKLLTTLLAASGACAQRVRIQAEAEQLAKLGDTAELLPNNDGAVVDLALLRQKQTLLPELRNIEIVERSRAFGEVVDDSRFEGYLDLVQLEERVRALQGRYPGWLEIVREDLPVTVEGRTLLVVKLEVPSNNPGDAVVKDNVLVVGAHHAREIVTPQIVMDMLEQLLRRTELRETLQRQRLFFVPVVNPDGYVQVWTKDNMHRKNKNYSAGGDGVDPNRNYHRGFSTCGGSSNPKSQTFRGDSPFSDSEAETLRRLTLKHRFAKVLDFHSYGREVLYGSNCALFDERINEMNKQDAIELADKADYRVRLPSADGEHVQMHLDISTNYAFLVETQTQFQPPYADALDEMKRLTPLWEAFLKKKPTFAGRVTDANGSPVEAALQVLDFIKLRRVTRSDGRFHLFLPSDVCRRGPVQVKIVPKLDALETKIVDMCKFGVGSVDVPIELAWDDGLLTLSNVIHDQF
ncbi:MAG: hypothetical protein MHM6MM_007272 [Cercozoa sp. M6MM]